MKKFLLLFIGLSISLIAQQKLTGSLYYDTQILSNDIADYNSMQVSTTSDAKKSPLLAGAMSFVLPGSGEIYSESYLKGGLFIIAEAALIYLKLHYDSQGDDQTEVYQNYAHERWDPVQYAEWTMQRFENQDVWYNKVIDPSQPQGVNWKELNNMEQELSRTEEGKYYSHHLAPFGDQQYYEMIGKYAQFNPGWDDFNKSDLSWRYEDGVTEHFSFYSGERGSANAFYDKASTVFAIVIVNHLLSAIDAVLTTSAFNKSLEMNVSLEKKDFGFEHVYYPELNLNIRL